ncbi:Uncharacterised protein [Vibrio cholerae]|nr:Uncharacterised protein [Vibrio cholerae]
MQSLNVRSYCAHSDRYPAVHPNWGRLKRD